MLPERLDSMFFISVMELPAGKNLAIRKFADGRRVLQLGQKNDAHKRLSIGAIRPLA
jgi:hypothetical protein